MDLLTHFQGYREVQPIGGVDGQDLERAFSELVDDVTLLYTGQVQLASRVLDGCDIFASRREKVAFFDIDDAANYGVVVEVMDVARGAGVKTLGLMTR